MEGKLLRARNREDVKKQQQRQNLDYHSEPCLNWLMISDWDSLLPSPLRFRQELDKDPLEQMLTSSMAALLPSAFVSCEQFVFAHIVS